MSNVSLIVQCLIPRPAWLLFLVSFLLIAPDRAAAKDAPGAAPPPPVQLNLKVRREGKTEIPLAIHGRANEPLKFLIRNPPTHGKLTEPRQTGRETATVVYEPPADLATTTDRFFYAVQSSVGVSAPVEVAITILDQPAKLLIPDKLDFGEMRAGATESRLLEISNVGGGLAAGEVIVDAPWRIDGRTGYSLRAGDLAVFKVVFAPTAGGTFESATRFTSDATRSTTLQGTAESAVTVEPAKMTLRHDVGDPVRTGSVELTNRTDQPRELEIKADPRLKLPGRLTLEARAKITLPVQTAPADVQAIHAEIQLNAADLALRIPVEAPALGPILRATQRAVTFSPVGVARPGSSSFEVENIGGTPGELTWTIAPPFRTAQTSTLLVPAEKRRFAIEIESKVPGRFRSWLKFHAGTQTFDLPVSAEVVATTEASPRVAVAPTEGASTAMTTPTPIIMPQGQVPSVIPNQWYGDRKLPAGVKISARTPTSATLEWPVKLAPARHYRFELRQLSRGESGGAEVTWLELGGLTTIEKNGNYVTTIDDLQPGKVWVIRVLPLNAEGKAGQRLFTIEFHTPKNPSYLPKISLFRILAVALISLLVWQGITRWKRRRQPFGL